MTMASPCARDFASIKQPSAASACARGLLATACHHGRNPLRRRLLSLGFNRYPLMHLANVRRSVTLLAAMAVCMTLIHACTSTTAPVVNEPDAAESGAGENDATVVDAEVDCPADRNNCSTSPKCCAPLTGRRVDLNRGCITNETIPIACGRRAVCVTDDAHSCWSRAVDGSTELFFSNFSWPDEFVRDFSRCAPGVEQQVWDAERQGACP